MDVWIALQSVPLDETLPSRSALRAHLSFDNAAETTLADRKEDVRSASGSASVDGDTDGAVCGVFEACGHGKRGNKLPVDLGLRGACANRAPGDEVCGVLRCDRIEELAPCGQTHVRHIQKQCAAKTEALVDLETPVHVRVVDEAFPANSGTRLFEVDTHDDEQVILGLVGVRFQKLGILECEVDVVNGAGSGDDESTPSAM